MPFFTQPAEPSVPTPEAAQTEINAILHNPDDLYHAAHVGKVGHDERVAEVASLFQRAYPAESVPGAKPPAALPVGKAGEPQSLPALPEGVVWNEAEQAEFQSVAQGLALPPETVARVLQLEAECWHREPPPSEQTLALLREEWGKAFDRKLHAAKWLVHTLIPPALHAALERSGLGDHPEMIRLAAAEGEARLEALGADKLLLAQIKRYRPGSEEYEAVVELRSALYESVYGKRGRM